MSQNNMQERLSKLREERAAREQARIQKLRELNLKKYPKSELQTNLANNQPSNSKIAKSTDVSQTKIGTVPKNVFHVSGMKHIKNNFHVNGTSKKTVTAAVPQKIDYKNVKPKVVAKLESKPKLEAKSKNHGPITAENGTMPVASTSNIVKSTVESIAEVTKPVVGVKQSTSASTLGLKPNKIVDKTTTQINNDLIKLGKSTENKVLTEITKKEIVNPKIINKNYPKLRQSLSAPTNSVGFDKPKPKVARKSMLPKLVEHTRSESVFERLYKPKYRAKKPLDEVEKLRTDPDYIKKMIKNTALILNKRHTIFEKKTSETNHPPRRSISAVHFKRISKNEVNNCIHKWSSIGDKLNKDSLELNEDEGIKQDKVVSAVKSERKKVQFMTPSLSNFNTPRPEELQARLKSWLQKRGKSLDSYHHLQCFGINHLETDLAASKHIPFEDAIQTPTKVNIDEENKENIALESDSDDGSYADTMNEPVEAMSAGDKIDVVNWRNASVGSESIGFNETNHFNDTTITSADTMPNVDELILGALNDLASLLREGFDWQQAARWLRSIRTRFPSAPRSAAYWECRAALEDARGDLPASVQCWEQAIAKGTERSVVESNLDQLLDKFMQLKISPQSGAPRQPDPKLVDVKNVFKSTIIRFAVQQAKLRRESEQRTPLFTVTPVRRSARLSHRPSTTPLRLCDTVRQAATVAPRHVFTPNKNFVHTP